MGQLSSNLELPTTDHIPKVKVLLLFKLRSVNLCLD